MKKIVYITILFVAGCALQPISAGGFVGYECYTYVGENLALTLPIPKADTASRSVQITLHGDNVPAIYLRNGLTQFWYLTEDLYIQVDPDFVARYMDFTNAKEGEQRKPKSVFKCKKLKDDGK